jgi:uncharacterized protein YjcR
MRELASGVTLASVSNNYGISVATLSTWKMRYELRADSGKSGASTEYPERC